MPLKRKASEVDPSSNSTPRPRGRPPKNKQPASTIADDDDGFEVLPKPPLPKRTRKVIPRAKQAGRNQDDRLGTGRGQKPTTVEQHLMDQNAKSKEFIQSFREDVTERQGKAHQTLKQFRRDMDKAHAGQQQELFAGANSAVASTSLKENPLYQQTQQMLQLCRSILKRHRIAEKESQRPGLVPPRAEWKHDEEKMVALLQCGRQYGEKLAEGLLGPEKVNPEDVAREAEGRGPEESENLAAALFEKTREAAGADTWGQVAHAQMKALAGVVRTLPASGRK
ncbi:hypothetical protein QBC34DRAFT_390685 [Podospora aff. communis PSN243]|uniref:Ribosome assembly protein 3 n=1 Tax=Podospora aff. communis PSN243 TaxID=3040156 RepID=A0AAV9H3R2_9PEZI|nr:hypothetical protein QBC34DRAFT_390685 [Podospora aff. communis PSN243]